MGVDWYFMVQSELAPDQLWAWSVALPDAVVRSETEFVYATEALVHLCPDSLRFSYEFRDGFFRPTYEWDINGVNGRSNSLGGTVAGTLFVMAFLRDHPGDCVYTRDETPLVRRRAGRTLARAETYGPGTNAEHVIRPPHAVVPVELSRDYELERPDVLPEP